MVFQDSCKHVGSFMRLTRSIVVQKSDITVSSTSMLNSPINSHYVDEL